MLIYREERLRDFDFYSTARTHANYLSYEQLDQLENLLTELYPDGVNCTDLNNFMSYGADVVAEGLGFANFAELVSQSVPFEVEGVERKS